jgi:hypothetical protein
MLDTVSFFTYGECKFTLLLKVEVHRVRFSSDFGTGVMLRRGPRNNKLLLSNKRSFLKPFPYEICQIDMVEGPPCDNGGFGLEPKARYHRGRGQRGDSRNNQGYLVQLVDYPEYSILPEIRDQISAVSSTAGSLI